MSESADRIGLPQDAATNMHADPAKFDNSAFDVGVATGSDDGADKSSEDERLADVEYGPSVGRMKATDFFLPKESRNPKSGSTSSDDEGDADEEVRKSGRKRTPHVIWEPPEHVPRRRRPRTAGEISSFVWPAAVRPLREEVAEEYWAGGDAADGAWMEDDEEWIMGQRRRRGAKGGRKQAKAHVMAAPDGGKELREDAAHPFSELDAPPALLPELLFKPRSAYVGAIACEKAEPTFAAMRGVLGDRRRKRAWAGSVLDSLIGVLLTQNVADHLSSAAFMNLMARWPPRSRDGADDGRVWTRGDESEATLIDSIDARAERLEGSFDDMPAGKDGQASPSHACPSHAPPLPPIPEPSLARPALARRKPRRGRSRLWSRQKKEHKKAACETDSEATGAEAVEPTPRMLRLLKRQKAVGEDASRRPIDRQEKRKETNKVSSEEQAEASPTRPSTPTPPAPAPSSRAHAWTGDSVDWEAVRTAPPRELEDAIKCRGMHVMLARRIQNCLCYVRDYNLWRKGGRQGSPPVGRLGVGVLLTEHGGGSHPESPADVVDIEDLGELPATPPPAQNSVSNRPSLSSLSLEWLRDLPQEEVADFLLSIEGIGTKSIACLTLLSLHRKEFPVDVNVGRIAARLGWIPLDTEEAVENLDEYAPEPEVHTYLKKRFMEFNLEIIYEVHYQMITLGKVFCHKIDPNCAACPLRPSCEFAQYRSQGVGVGAVGPRPAKPDGPVPAPWSLLAHLARVERSQSSERASLLDRVLRGVVRKRRSKAEAAVSSPELSDSIQREKSVDSAANAAGSETAVFESPDSSQEALEVASEKAKGPGSQGSEGPALITPTKQSGRDSRRRSWESDGEGCAPERLAGDESDADAPFPHAEWLALLPLAQQLTEA
ncbi:hypothetical protein H632_c392p0, partial [Helicosporidium sp. ATCC 50920]